MTTNDSDCPSWATAIGINLCTPGLAYWVGHDGYSVIASPSSKELTPYGKGSTDFRNRDCFKPVFNLVEDKTPASDVVKASKYHRLMQSQMPPVYDDNGDFLGIMVDFYDVALAFDPENRTAPEDHALKKLILPGKRGVKDVLKDLSEVIWSLQAGIRIRIAEKRKQDFNSKK